MNEDPGKEPIFQPKTSLFEFLQGREDRKERLRAAMKEFRRKYVDPEEDENNTKILVEAFKKKLSTERLKLDIVLLGDSEMFFVLWDKETDRKKGKHNIHKEHAVLAKGHTYEETFLAAYENILFVLDSKNQEERIEMLRKCLYPNEKE